MQYILASQNITFYYFVLNITQLILHNLNKLSSKILIIIIIF